MSELQMLLFGKPFPLPAHCLPPSEEVAAPKPRRKYAGEIMEFIAPLEKFVIVNDISRRLRIHLSNARRTIRALESRGLAETTHRKHANRDQVLFVKAVKPVKWSALL